MPALIAEILLAEFEELKSAFPASSNALDKIAELTDRKAIIPLSRVTTADMSILPQDVTDRLYKAALAMRE